MDFEVVLIVLINFVNLCLATSIGMVIVKYFTLGSVNSYGQILNRKEEVKVYVCSLWKILLYIGFAGKVIINFIFIL